MIRDWYNTIYFFYDNWKSYDVNILDRYETTLYKKIKVNLESGENALAYIENHKD